MASTKSRFFVMSGAILAVMTLPTIATADHSGQARPSLHSAAVPPTTKGACLAEKQAFASSAYSQSTTSQTPMDLLGATLKPTITQGCLVVDFTAQAYAPNNNILYVEVLLDGSAMTPGKVQMTGSDAQWAGSHAFSFVAAGLSSGPHTIQVQFSNLDGATAVYVDKYTLLAHYD